MTGALPDETTILNFRRLLETHDLAAQMFAAVNAHLHARGLTLQKGAASKPGKRFRAYFPAITVQFL